MLFVPDEAAVLAAMTDGERALRALVARCSTADSFTRAAFIATLSPAETAALFFCWRAWARPSQLAPPGDWRFWLVQAGRGFGKTRTAAEYVRDEVSAGRASVIGLVGGDVGDVRDVMIEGPAGILAVTPKAERPVWTKSLRKLVWPNGAQALTFSSEDPEALRGPQHDLVWGDELARWAYPAETFSNLDFGLRLVGPDGTRPRGVFTTTPRPIKTLRDLIARDDVVVTRGSTFDNAANLPPGALASLKRKYAGTRLGRQELDAELMEDVQGALWTLQMIADALELGRSMNPEFRRRTVVAIDPSANDGDEESGSEVGIIVVAEMPNDQILVLDDLSGSMSPKQWGATAVKAFGHWRADRIVAEANNGGEMVRGTIHAVDPTAPVRLVHAATGKRARAEPAAALYERPGARVGHRRPFPVLEDQLRTFTNRPGERSPDRHDALVWGIHDLVKFAGAGNIEVDPSLGHILNQWSGDDA